jgi:hypothetical protein
VRDESKAVIGRILKGPKPANLPVQALAAAREVAHGFASWRPAIEQALFEHYEP